MLESGVMAMEVVVVVCGIMVLEGVAGEICCSGTVMVFKKVNYTGIWCCCVMAVVAGCRWSLEMVL